MKHNRRRRRMQRRVWRFLGRPDQPLRNVLGSRHSRRALLSYIEPPFLRAQRAPRHTNTIEARTWAGVLDDLGHAVDVVDFRSPGVALESYDVICGFGEPLEEAIRSTPPREPVKIFYGTGCSSVFSNRAAAGRVLDLYHREGIWNPSGARFIASAWPLQNTLADGYVSLGTAFSQDTFTSYRIGGEVRRVPAFFLDDGDLPAPEQKDDDTARRNVLWFGSNGAVHKGLDLVIAAARALPGMTVHLAGVSDQDAPFVSRLVGDLANVRVHGFLTVGTQPFRDVMQTCGAVVMPSASEGGSAAVLTAVAHGGLIPLVSAACAVDLDGGEIPIEPLTLDAVLAALRAFAALSSEERGQRGRDVQAWCRRHNTPTVYQASLREVVAELIQA